MCSIWIQVVCDGNFEFCAKAAAFCTPHNYKYVPFGFDQEQCLDCQWKWLADCFVNVKISIHGHIGNMCKCAIQAHTWSDMCHDLDLKHGWGLDLEQGLDCRSSSSSRWKCGEPPPRPSAGARALQPAAIIPRRYSLPSIHWKQIMRAEQKAKPNIWKIGNGRALLLTTIWIHDLHDFKEYKKRREE